MLIFISMVSLVLAGCGGSNKASATYDYNSYMATEEAAMAEEYDYSAERYSDDVYEMKAAGSSNGAEAEEITDEDVQSSSSRKLIKTVNLSVETREFDELISNVSARIEQLGGYAESTDISGNSYDSYSRRNAYIVARIPQEKLGSFVSSIESQSNITSRSESAEDVTLQYSDVKAHIDSLKIEQERLNELLKNADTLETIVALESRLTEVRYEVESYESRLRTMDNQVTFSTVYLNISEVKEYKPEPVEDPTFVERLVEAFTGSCESAWEAIQDFVIGLIAFIPILIVILVILGVIGGIIFLIIKIVLKIVKKSGKSVPKAPKKLAKSGKKDKPVEASEKAEEVKTEETSKSTDTEAK